MQAVNSGWKSLHCTISRHNLWSWNCGCVPTSTGHRFWMLKWTYSALKKRSNPQCELTWPKMCRVSSFSKIIMSSIGIAWHVPKGLIQWLWPRVAAFWMAGLCRSWRRNTLQPWRWEYCACVSPKSEGFQAVCHEFLLGFLKNFQVKPKWPNDKNC